MAHEVKEQIVRVTQPAGVTEASDAARKYAAAIGFKVIECEEISLVVSELGTNLLKHAGGGVIKFSTIEAGNQPGIQIESEDNGPGISDAELAITDGYSSSGSLGNGLGTVNRLMDALEFRSRAQGGLHIFCKRSLRPSPSRFPLRWLEFGAATRSCRLLPDNGDAMILQQWEGQALVGVIDGLGHGALARRAAQAARLYVEQHFHQPLQSIFEGVERTCRATRGVVMALARLEMAEKKFSVASIGNVEVRLLNTEQPFHPAVRRGILGSNAPKPLIAEHGWTSASVLVIHSDGVSQFGQSRELNDLTRQTPAAIALQLLRQFGRIEDDATVVVAKNAAV